MPRESTLLLLVLMSTATLAIVFSGQNNVHIQDATAVTVSAGIGVYWDESATNSCRSISWGQLAPGARKTVVLYLKNEGADSIYYLLTTDYWFPADASGYMTLRWDYNGTRAVSGSVRRVSLVLVVSPRVHGVVDFTFDIVILGSPYFWGDINHDSKVDGEDLAVIAQAFGSEPGASAWSSTADLNQDDKVDGKDLGIVAQNYGKTFI